MKFSRAVILLLIISILVISIWNIIQLNRCKRSYERQKLIITRKDDILKKIESLVINTQIISMKYLGRYLLLSNLEKIYPNGKDRLKFQKNPKLVLILSEFGCNACQDNETKFAVDVSNSFDEKYVLAIVQASNQRYIINYVRQNQVNFPVYYCEDDKFLELNQVIDTPLILILDKDNRIIASHLPITGYPEYSEPIHQFCLHYFKQYEKAE